MWVAACLQTANTDMPADRKAGLVALEKLNQRVAVQLGIQFYSSLLRGELATDVVGGLSVTDLMEEFVVSLSSYCQ